MAEPLVAAPAPAPVQVPVIAAAAAPAPAVEAAPAPVAAAVAPAPVSSEPATSPVAAAAATESAPPTAPVASSPEAAAADPTPTPSLLTEAVKPPAGEPAPAPDAPPPEAPVVTYEPFTLPEGITLAEKDVGRYTEVLAKHKAPQELGQDLINLHLEEVQKTRAAIDKANRDGWHQTRTQWADEVRADPDLGGARLQTTLTRCADVMDRFAGDPVAFRDMLKLTGTDNHPLMVGFLNNIGKVLSEPRAVPAPKPMPLPTTKAQRRYGNMNGAT